MKTRPGWLLGMGCLAVILGSRGAAAEPPSATPPAPPLSLPFTLPSKEQLERALAGELLDPTRQLPASRDEFLAALDEFARALPAAELDLPTASAAQKPGLAAAFEFVRDRIAFESYRGVLRGPQVTLATRAGNALDRSLLLASLLQRQNVKTRFARGRLPAVHAQALFDRIFEAPPPPPRLSAARVAAHSGRASSLLARVTARAQRDYARIRAALREALPADAEPSRQSVLEEIADHVWVQADVEGKWVDLDASFPGNAIGGTRCPSAETMERLPRELFQTLTLRVVVERLAGASLERETVLEFTRPAVTLIDQELFVFHVPESVGLAGAIASAASPDVWRPSLLVGGQLIAGKPIEFAVASSARSGGPPAGGLGGLFGSGGPLAVTRPQLVAEWLEFDLAIPGREKEVTRRALVDRAGPAWRLSDGHKPDALKTLARDEHGPLSPRTVHSVWITAGRHNLAALAESAYAWATSVAAPAGAATKASGRRRKMHELLRPLSVQSAATVAMTDEIVAAGLNDQRGLRFYADSPRITVISVGTPPQSDVAQRSVTIDLRRDRPRGVAQDATRTAAVVERKLWYAALEGALEHETLWPYAGGPDGRPVDSTSARAGRGRPLLVQAGESAKVVERFDADGLALAEEALRTGHRLVLSSDPSVGGRAAWWEIARDGTTRAVLGQDLNGGDVWWFPPVPHASGWGQSTLPGVVPREPPADWSYPGVIPKDPGGASPMWRTDPHWQPDFTDPNWEPDFTVRSPAPEEKTQKTRRPPDEPGSDEAQGAGNEYTLILKEEAVPNPEAVLQGYVDNFLEGSAEVASRVAAVLSDLFTLWS